MRDETQQDQTGKAPAEESRRGLDEGRGRRFVATVAVLIVACAGSALGCGGEKKKPASKDDFQTVSDTVTKTLTAAPHTADERKSYVVGQLGPPHRVDGPQRYWYSAPPGCYYLAMGEDGWVSWGTGDRAADCKKWAVVK